MHFRVRVAALALPIAVGASLFWLAGPGPRAVSPDDTPNTNLGKAITKLDLKDTAGKTWAVADLQGRKAVVVLFLGTQCPINNAYLLLLHHPAAKRQLRSPQRGGAEEGHPRL